MQAGSPQGYIEATKRDRQLDRRFVMGAIIAVSNQQRGVGKTTITLNLARELATRGFRVLMVDNDPQADLTTSMSALSPVQPDALGLYEGHAVDPREVSKDLFIIGADIGLSTVDGQGYEAVFDFKNELLKLKYDYDFIFIDSLPSLGIMHTAALATSDYLMIVIELSPLLCKGIRDLIESAGKIIKHLNSGLKVLGIVINQVVDNDDSNKNIKKCLFDKYPNLAFDAVLSKWTDESGDTRRDRVSRGPEPDPQCRIMNEELMKLTDEILRRIERL